MSNPIHDYMVYGPHGQSVTAATTVRNHAIRWAIDHALTTKSPYTVRDEARREIASVSYSEQDGKEFIGLMDPQRSRKMQFVPVVPGTDYLAKIDALLDGEAC